MQLPVSMRTRCRRWSADAAPRLHEDPLSAMERGSRRGLNGADPRNEQFEKFCSVSPRFKLSCRAVRACWWLSLVWLGAGAPGSFVPGAAWWGCGFFCFPFRGRRPKDLHFCRYLPLSSGTSVPCTRSPESAGHFVQNSVMGQMVGSRRSPGATILGGELEYVTCQPSLYGPADRLRTS